MSHAGLNHSDIVHILEYVEDFNEELAKPMALRKVAVRRASEKHLLTIEHMISYDRSFHVQKIIKNLKMLNSFKMTHQMCLDVSSQR